MPVKTIMEYFLNSSDSSEKLISRKKPNGILIKAMDDIDKDNTTPFLQNFTMPKKKIVPKEMEIKPKSVNNFTKLVLSNQEVSLKKPEVKPEIKNPEFDGVRIYTDGSCILNGKPNARGGWAVYFPGGQFKNMAEKYTNHPTNQRCELTAIQKAIEATKEYIIGGGKIEIYTDSEYSLKCLQEYCKKWSINGWIKADKKPIENRDIIEPLYNFYSMYWRQISIKHVRAHTGRQDIHSKANDVVDQMARSTIF
jgi:ribonuclease HI